LLNNVVGNVPWSDLFSTAVERLFRRTFLNLIHFVNNKIFLFFFHFLACLFTLSFLSPGICRYTAKAFRVIAYWFVGNRFARIRSLNLRAFLFFVLGKLNERIWKNETIFMDCGLGNYFNGFCENTLNVITVWWVRNEGWNGEFCPKTLRVLIDGNLLLFCDKRLFTTSNFGNHAGLTTQSFNNNSIARPKWSLQHKLPFNYANVSIFNDSRFTAVKWIIKLFLSFLFWCELIEFVAVKFFFHELINWLNKLEMTEEISFMRNFSSNWIN
jgi:hypothetical protein